MKPVAFEGQNVVYGSNQPEYEQLPAHKDKDGVVISCWSFSLSERLKILFGAKVYWQQMTFNELLQPVKPCVGLKDLEDNFI